MDYRNYSYYYHYHYNNLAPHSNGPFRDGGGAPDAKKLPGPTIPARAAFPSQFQPPTYAANNVAFLPCTFQGKEKETATGMKTPNETGSVIYASTSFGQLPLAAREEEWHRKQAAFPLLDGKHSSDPPNHNYIALECREGNETQTHHLNVHSAFWQEIINSNQMKYVLKNTACMMHMDNMTKDPTRKKVTYTGVLDIAGGEIFGYISTNEKLQQFSNSHMFTLGQDWANVDFDMDPQRCIDIFEKPMAFLAILEEESLFPKATYATFTEKLMTNLLVSTKKENVVKAVETIQQVQSELANIVTKEIMIPSKIHNTVIGAGGKLIQSIMSECGRVAIKFPENGSVSDKVTVSRPVDDVEKAIKLPRELSDEKQLSGISTEVKAKSQHHKFLIGRAGCHIQTADLEKKTNDSNTERRLAEADASSQQLLEKLLEVEKDIEDDGPWITEKEHIINSNNSGHCLNKVQNRIKNREAPMAEFTNHESTIYAVFYITQLMNTLKEKARQRRRYWEDSLKTHQYFAKATEAEPGMTVNTDNGKDADASEALVKKHEALKYDLEMFNTTIAGLKEQIRTIFEEIRDNGTDNLVAKMQDTIYEPGIKYGHFGGSITESKMKEVKQIISFEDECNHLSKLKKSFDEIEDFQEKKVKGDVEKSKRKIDGELKTTQEAVSNLDRVKAELGQTVACKEKEANALAAKIEDEVSLGSKYTKQVKELQARPEELDKELSIERSNRAKAEKNRSMLKREIEDVAYRLEEAGSNTSTQVELKKKKAELARLKSELEELNIEHEGTLSALRIKHDNTMTELDKNIDNLNNNKVKSEKDKGGIEKDLADSSAALEDAIKSKVEMDKQQKLLQKSMVDEMARDMNETEFTKKKCEVKRQDLNQQIEKLENGVNQSKAKSSLMTQLKAQAEIQLWRSRYETEGRNFSSEIFRLKAAQDEAVENIDIINEITDLLDRLEGGRSILDKQRRNPEQEKEEQQTALVIAKVALEQDENKTLRAVLELSQVRRYPKGQEEA